MLGVIKLTTKHTESRKDKLYGIPDYHIFLLPFYCPDYWLKYIVQSRILEKIRTSFIYIVFYIHIIVIKISN